MSHWGIPKSIVEAEEYYALSSLSIEFIDSDPFSTNAIEYFVRGTTYGNDSILEFLFPSYPQGCNWFSKWYMITPLVFLRMLFVSYERWQFCELNRRNFRIVQGMERRKEWRKYLGIHPPLIWHQKKQQSFVPCHLLAFGNFPFLKIRPFIRIRICFQSRYMPWILRVVLGFIIVTFHRTFELIFSKIVLRYTGNILRFVLFRIYSHALMTNSPILVENLFLKLYFVIFYMFGWVL